MTRRIGTDRATFGRALIIAGLGFASLAPRSRRAASMAHTVALRV